MPMPQTVNGKPVRQGCWTAEEDELLSKWQSVMGNKWSSVAKKIVGRTGQQCAQRWRHKVNPNIRKDKWTAEEDDQLRALVKEYGSSWAEISRNIEVRAETLGQCWLSVSALLPILGCETAILLQGRTDQQCMGRWRRHLDPSIRRSAWSAAEDATLHAQYAHYGSRWSSIARALPGRTAQQCRARWVGGRCLIGVKA
eukprot:jgi/Astpho2/9442/Aster-01702